MLIKEVEISEIRFSSFALRIKASSAASFMISLSHDSVRKISAVFSIANKVKKSLESDLSEPRGPGFSPDS
jgi:hypothetical protein